MPVLGDEHDYQHPVEGDAAWSESYYFNGYDDGEGVGFFTRVGIRPNEGTMDASLSIWLPGGDVAHLRARRPQADMVDTSLEVGPVRYDCVTPMREWHLGGRGQAVVQALGALAPGPPAGGRPAGRAGGAVDVELDVTFHNLTPPIGAPGDGGQGDGGQGDGGQGDGGQGEGAAQLAGGSVGKGHFEQAGRLEGTITVDGRPHRLAEARGNRDKSWGPRRWDVPRMWRWFSVNIGDDVAFGGIRLATAAGDLHRGWVWRDGSASSVAEWRITTEVAPDGLTQRHVRLDVLDKTGNTHRVEGEVMRVAPLSRGRGLEGTLVNEGLVHWRYEGRSGTGIAEYLHQLDGTGHPLVPIE
jgi:hypothetical protein